MLNLIIHSFVFTYSLINQLKPGIIKRLNRLSTPIAGLVSVSFYSSEYFVVWYKYMSDEQRVERCVVICSQNRRECEREAQLLNHVKGFCVFIQRKCRFLFWLQAVLMVLYVNYCKNRAQRTKQKDGASPGAPPPQETSN